MKTLENDFFNPFECCSAGILVRNAETRKFVHANSAFAKLLGCEPDELTLLESKNLFPAESLAHSESELNALADGKKILVSCIPCLKKDGTIIHTDAYASNAGVAGGEYHVFFFTDSAKRKSSEKEIFENEEKYRTILENIEQVYYETDLAGNFTFFNAPLCDLLGFSRRELTGMNYRQYMDRENADKVRGICKNVYRTGVPDRGFVWDFIRKDGSIRQIGASVFPMKNREGRPVGFRGIARDISERKKTETETAQNQKLESIGRLAAGIAHEINTPTQYVGDNTHFLKDSFRDIDILLRKFENLLAAVKAGDDTAGLVPELEAAIETADVDYLREEIPVAIGQSLEGVDRVANIVRAMKEFSYPGGDEKTPMDINKAISGTITITRNEWKYIAEMKTDFDESLHSVPIFPDEFNQVILNLIINAVHAIEDKQSSDGKLGVIGVSTNLDGDWVEIRISDTGPGIPKVIRPMLFEPFFTTKGVGRGTGQGLAISHSVIVKKHGGSIRFETEMGKGTVFIIRIPVDD